MSQSLVFMVGARLQKVRSYRAIHFFVFLPIASRNSIREVQIHRSKRDNHIQNVLQQSDDSQLFSESHKLAGCARSLPLLPRRPFVGPSAARPFSYRANVAVVTRDGYRRTDRSLGAVAWRLAVSSEGTCSFTTISSILAKMRIELREHVPTVARSKVT